MTTGSETRTQSLNFSTSLVVLENIRISEPRMLKERSTPAPPRNLENTKYFSTSSMANHGNRQLPKTNICQKKAILEEIFKCIKLKESPDVIFRRRSLIFRYDVAVERFIFEGMYTELWWIVNVGNIDFEEFCRYMGICQYENLRTIFGSMYTNSELDFFRLYETCYSWWLTGYFAKNLAEELKQIISSRVYIFWRISFQNPSGKNLPE